MVEYGLEWSALSSYFQMIELETEPATPQANHLRLYAKDKSGSSALYYKNDAGVVFDLTAGANTVHTTDADWIDLTDGGTTTLHTHAAAGGMAIGDSITSATEGSVLFAGAAGVLAQDNSHFFYADSINRLALGSAGLGHSTGSLLSLESNSGNTTWESACHSAGDTNEVRFRSSRGSHASPTAVTAADTILVWACHGHDGTGYILSSYVAFAIDGTPGTNDMPGKISFFTTPDGSATAVERVLFGNDGGIAIQDGITAPATRTGWATIYVDTADGDLKIKYGDGTVKLIVVDT